MARLVCLCNLVDEREIASMLKKGCNSVDELKRFTGAGTSCGRCHIEISSIFEKHKKEKPKDQQIKLDFGF